MKIITFSPVTDEEMFGCEERINNLMAEINDDVSGLYREIAELKQKKKQKKQKQKQKQK